MDNPDITSVLQWSFNSRPTLRQEKKELNIEMYLLARTMKDKSLMGINCFCMRHLVEVYDDVHITLSLCVYDNQCRMIAKLAAQCKYYFMATK